MENGSSGFRISEEDGHRLDLFHDALERERGRFIGYPCTAEYDYSPLYRFLGFPINNVGDPFIPSNYHLNTHEFEREVLEFFRELLHAPADGFWGYVTNGGTEGNIYGIYLGREMFPDGMVYYSEDTHYSVSKALRLLHIRNLTIKSLPDGRIDLDDLRETIRIHRDVPPIIFANIGTTMKGAVDDLKGIHKILKELAVQRYYIHADAALSGMILPFVEDPQPFDFQAGIDSLSISGHKMIGCPFPCGIALAKKSNVDRTARSIEYIGTLDTTLVGSRNGYSPLFLWYAIRTYGVEGFRQRVRRCLEVAEYAVGRLHEVGKDAWRHKNSVTAVFPRPSMKVSTRWQLAVHNEWAHIIAMPHVTKAMVDLAIEDIRGDATDPAAAGEDR
jgi:histidine decarboxylase